MSESATIQMALEKAIRAAWCDCVGDGEPRTIFNNAGRSYHDKCGRLVESELDGERITDFMAYYTAGVCMRGRSDGR